MKNMTFRKSLTAAAVAASLGFPALALAQDAQTDVNAEEEVERIQVTGSRIKRTDLEGSLPITVIDREAIDLSGDISVSDLVRDTTFNSFGSYRTTSGNASQGTTQVSLRGLGADRTLILIDGRRLAKSPLTGASQDLNQIPLAAVERVEVLQDGASAVYGSDAIGGVINIVTRKDYNGAELRLGTGSVSIPEDGGDREEGSFVIGSSDGTTSLLAGLSWNEREIIFERWFPWNQGEQGVSPYGNNWADLNSQGNPPSAIFAQSMAEGCDFDLYYTTENPWIGGPMCSFNFLETNASDASQGTQSAFFRGEHQLNRDWKIYSNVNYSKSKSFGRYAPSLNDPGSVLSADSPNNPTNPDSPLFDSSIEGGQRDVAVFHRFAAIGTRDTDVDNYATDVMGGFEGRIGSVEVDVGVRRSKNKAYNYGRGYLLRSAADEAMNSGEYMLNDPYGERFTTEEDQAAYQSLLDSLNVTIFRDSQFDQDEVYGSAAFDLMNLDAGTVQMVVGGEWRKEEYSDQYDSLSEAGVVGGSAGNSAAGTRYVRSAYFESLIPLTQELEMTLAGRYEDYSDYGSDFAPKVSFRYEPMDGMVIRASYGQGFQAPTLDLLTMKPSPGNPQVRDYVLCDANGTPTSDCPEGQIRATTIANPDLSSEQSDQYSLGFAYQPTDWLNFAVDYYNISIEDRIAFLGLQTIINRERVGDAIPAALGVERDPNTQAILSATTGYTNDGTLDTSGLDLNVQTNFDFGEFGSLNQTFQYSHVLNYELDNGRNTVRDPGVPRARASLSNSYNYEDFSVAWITKMIGNQYDDVDNSGGTVERSGNIATWVTHDLQVSYRTPWDGEFSVGAQNVFEKYPQLNTSASDGRGYDYTLYHGYGRIMYARYTQRF